MTLIAAIITAVSRRELLFRFSNGLLAGCKPAQKVLFFRVWQPITGRMVDLVVPVFLGFGVDKVNFHRFFPFSVLIS